MILMRGCALAACLAGLVLVLGESASCQAGEPLVVRPAIHSSSTPVNVTPVFHRHYGRYGYGGYGFGYGGYGYGGYRGYGFAGHSPYYGYGYSSSPYFYGSYYRPYYSYPMAHYRYGYYSYPTYRTFGYPYSYNGLYTTGYYGGLGYTGFGVGLSSYGLGYSSYGLGYAGTYVSSPVYTTSVYNTPYVYGGYYNYPMYSGSCGCAW